LGAGRRAIGVAGVRRKKKVSIIRNQRRELKDDLKEERLLIFK